MDAKTIVTIARKAGCPESLIPHVVDAMIEKMGDYEIDECDIRDYASDYARKWAKG